METEFVKITDAADIPLTIKELYYSSFPEEERRPWEDVIKRIDGENPFFSLYVIKHKGEDAGFITLWRLPGALYCEHFAILPNLRGEGIGSAVIEGAIGMASPNPLVLEVELPEKSADAQRRIEFYKRCGMIPMEEFPYWQPPYRTDLPSVAMMLMSSSPLADPTAFVMMLHTLVYNQ